MKNRLKSKHALKIRLRFSTVAMLTTIPPQLGKDLVKVFNKMDIGVQLLKREKCCGVALIANGFVKQAKKQATVNLESLTQKLWRTTFGCCYIFYFVLSLFVMNMNIF